MKITFLLPHVRISGGVKALLEYSNRLQNMGHFVRIFIPGKTTKWYRFDLLLKTRQGLLKILPPETVDWMSNSLPIEVFPKTNST